MDIGGSGSLTPTCDEGFPGPEGPIGRLLYKVLGMVAWVEADLIRRCARVCTGMAET